MVADRSILEQSFALPFSCSALPAVPCLLHARATHSVHPNRSGSRITLQSTRPAHTPCHMLLRPARGVGAWRELAIASELTLISTSEAQSSERERSRSARCGQACAWQASGHDGSK